MGENINTQLKLAFDFVQFTNKNIFLTGKAGTGKTTFLHQLKKILPKRMVVVAPTGVAAINAGGVTMHSFFQLSFGPQIPEYKNAGLNPSSPNSYVRKFSKEKRNIIKTLDLLVIDEISMVRADLLDGVDQVLRQYKNRSKPFGGVQLLMIGDLQQLAPVVKEEERNILKEYYDTVFFFGSKALQKTNYISIELKLIYRQTDQKFIDLLNKLRDNKLDQNAIEELNKKYKPGVENNPDEGYIILTTHNAKAQSLNHSKLEKIQEKAYTFNATVQGDFPAHTYPADAELTLKKEAQVMFIKNDHAKEKQYYNGKIGTITDIDEKIIYVKCPGESHEIEVEIAEWQNIKYSINKENKEIQETIVGTFNQYPLKLAWAITIHKSQGLTFEKAIIDANWAFAHGQVYVALSRCKSLEGLVLSSEINQASLKNDFTVSEFTRGIEQNPPDEQILNQSKKEYEFTLLMGLYNLMPLQSFAFECLKIANNNKENIQGNFLETTNKIFNDIKTEITKISEKFIPQLERLIHNSYNTDEGSNLLKAKLKKSSAYFIEKINHLIITPLKNITVETDNKAIGKSIKESIEQLMQESRIKTSCLKTCFNGFSAKAFLKAQALAALEKPILKTTATNQNTSPASIIHQELYNSLKNWRNKTADEQNVPVYMILALKTISELSTYLPFTFEDLKQVKGIGKRKIEQYGDEILTIIKDYCTENNVQAPERIIEIPVPKEKNSDTKKISLELLKEGKSIEEIALERGMVVRTIEGHIAYYIRTGELNILQFVTPENISLISEYFLKSDNKLLSPAKEALGNDISYRDLNFVLKHLEYTGQLNSIN